MFPEYKSFLIYPWNKAFLTHRQHFIAHLLLWKAYPKSYSCVDAIWGMKCRRKTFMNSRIYDKLRVEAVTNISKRNKNKVVVYDKNNPEIYFKSNIDDQNYLNGNYIPILKGISLKDDHKHKISNTSKGVRKTTAHKNNISSGLRGKKKSSEHTEKVRKALTGRLLSETHKENIGKGQLGLKRSDETREKMSKSQKGKIVSNETKDKISEKMSGINHHKHKYFYSTPIGIFDSASSLIDMGISREKMKTWCIKCDRKISLRVYRNSIFLQTNFFNNIVGKTYREIGFSVIAKDQIS
jgi:hypothetical protein